MDESAKAVRGPPFGCAQGRTRSKRVRRGGIREGLGLELGRRAGIGVSLRDSFDLADDGFAGEGFLEEESVLEEIVAGCGLFEIAGHIDDFEMGVESLEALARAGPRSLA